MSKEVKSGTPSVLDLKLKKLFAGSERDMQRAVARYDFRSLARASDESDE